MSTRSQFPNPSGGANIFTIAADGSAPRLLAELRASADPTALANSQDSTGYSLVHALASYNHLDLLREVHREFPFTKNLKDEDGETALFVVETVAAAQCLVEELKLVDWEVRNLADETAEEKIRAEGDFVTVADYLAQVHRRGEVSSTGDGESMGHPPPLPPGVKMEMGTMTVGDETELPAPDPEFRRRIEELAARDDFQSEEGQAQLKQLIQDAVRGVNSDDRDVRQRTE